MQVIPDTATPAEVVELLKECWGLPSNAELARHIEVSRASVGNYASRKTSDLQTSIILVLLRDVAYLEGKLND